jgi:hypothetical protein
VTLKELNAMDILEARAAFELCCGAQRWIDGMLMRKPFSDESDLIAAGREIWGVLGPKGWEEALSHQPRVESIELLRLHWSQAAPSDAERPSEEDLRELKFVHDMYFDTYGYPFISAANPRTVGETVAAIRARLDRDPGTELLAAAAEHEEITVRRIKKLLKISK